MKKNIQFLVSVLAISAILTSCSNTSEKGISIGFAKGAKISSTGLNTVNSGLRLTDSYLIADGVKMQNNEVQQGQKVAIVFEGIEGFKERKGKVFPVLNIVVLDTGKQVVVSYADLLKSDTGYDAKDATVLTGALTVGDPLKQGQSYNLTVSVGDKEGEGSIVGNVTLKVK